MKPAGLLFILVSFGYLGIHMSSRLFRRVETLEYFIRAVEAVRAEMRFSQPSIPYLFDVLAKDPRFSRPPFFESVARGLRDKTPVSIAFEKHLRERAHDYCLKDADADILLRFAYALGGSDLEGQEGLCALTLEELRSQREAAREFCRTHSRSYRLLGILSGLFVCLLLI